MYFITTTISAAGGIKHTLNTKASTLEDARTKKTELELHIHEAIRGALDYVFVNSEQDGNSVTWPAEVLRNSLILVEIKENRIPERFRNE